MFRYNIVSFHLGCLAARPLLSLPLFHLEQSSLKWIAIPRGVIQLNMGVVTHLKTLKDIRLCTDQKLIQVQMHNKSEAFLCDISHSLNATLGVDTQRVHFVLCIPLQHPTECQTECLGSESRLSCVVNYISCACRVLLFWKHNASITPNENNNF